MGRAQNVQNISDNLRGGLLMDEDVRMRYLAKSGAFIKGADSTQQSQLQVDEATQRHFAKSGLSVERLGGSDWIGLACQNRTALKQPFWRPANPTRILDFKQSNSREALHSHPTTLPEA